MTLSSSTKIKGKRVLYLSLKKLPFDVMVTGEKKNEFRVTSKWLTSRLVNKDGTEKHFDLIHYTNGYGPDKPWFVCEYNGVTLNTDQQCIRFSNGLDVQVNIGDTIIFGGEVIEKGNFTGQI